MGFVGSMYASGMGTDQDNATALQWLQKSADAGSATGQCGLGLLYMHGQGVPRDYEKAAQVWAKGWLGGSG